MDERIDKHKNDVRVSMVVPVYNVSAYIERCIKSVMNQTYHNIECIIVDDCTPDDSIEKAKKMVDTYNGDICFKFVAHAQNGGLSAGRNTGTIHSTGDYIYYLDSDDEIYPNCIELMVEEVRKHPEVEMVQGLVESKPHNSYYDMPYFDGIDYIDDNIKIRHLLYQPVQHFPVNAWNKLLKKSFLEQYSLKFKEGLIHEDELWMYYTGKVLSKLAIVHYYTCIHYCGTTGSIMTTNSKVKTAKHWATILEETINNFDNPYYKEQLLTYTWRLVRSYGDIQNSVEYRGLFNRYCQELKKQGFGIIFINMWIMRLTYPILQGKWTKRLLMHQLSHHRIINGNAN